MAQVQQDAKEALKEKFEKMIDPIQVNKYDNYQVKGKIDEFISIVSFRIDVIL
jgi:hypothetical protein